MLSAPPIESRPALARPCLVIVMGVAGSGKSTLARALAQHYSCVFLDGDDFHSQDARERMSRGEALDDSMRQPWVARMREHLRKSHTQPQKILAFSGLRRAHRDELRKAGHNTLFLFLQSDIHTIQQRVNQRAGHFMAPSLVSSQFDTLEPPVHETDVKVIDANQAFDQVFSDAIKLVDTYKKMETCETHNQHQ